MRNIIRLIALLVVFAACGPQSQEAKPTPSPTPLWGKPLPGHVILLTGVPFGTYSERPNSIKVNIYPESLFYDGSNIHFFELPVETDNAYDVDAKATLRIGCEGSESTLTENIATKVLEWCGDLNFKGSSLNIKAETIIFNNLNLNAEIFYSGPKNKEGDELNIEAHRIILKGSNSVSGLRIAEERKLHSAPQMYFHYQYLYGDGQLQINSITGFLEN